MTFLTRNAPKLLSDLVFHETTVAETISDYANGLRDKHLLLYGPAGSGKTIAAQMILNTRLGSLAGSTVAKPINPRDYGFDNFSPLLNDWSTQRMNGVPRGYTLIDEVDFFSDRMRERLRAFLDSTELGTIIATTNNLHLLDDPFKDRFRKLHIVRPTAQDWVQRAQTVMASEGVNLATQQVSMLLNGFEGSARNMMDWLEDYVFALKRNATFSALPATAVGCVKPAPGVSLINGKPSLRH
jgi:replication-associated recombination protein RarA